MSRPTTTAGREARARENAVRRAARAAEQTAAARRPAVPAVAHIDKRQRVELVRWKPGTADYELVAGLLVRRTATEFVLATDDGRRAYPRDTWLLCEADEAEEGER